MAPLSLLLLASLGAAAEPGPTIDEASCSHANVRRIQAAWPEARKRVAAAKAAVEKAYSGDDQQTRRKLLAYARMVDGNLASLPEIARILGLLDGVLERSRFVCGGKADRRCHSRNGYVLRGEGEIIHLCPAVLKDSKYAVEQRIRNMTHEAAHIVDPQISQPEGEGYCIAFDCEMVCPGRVPYLVADNWAHFTHCASGQKPEEGMLVEGDPSPGAR